MNIVDGDLENEQVLELLREHLLEMHRNSPVGSVYALDVSGLDVPEVKFYAAWMDDVLLGFAALHELSPISGEIKSMRTHSDHLRKGVAGALLEHILSEAQRRKYCLLSLETGTGEAFEAALALYRKYGFTNGEAFAEYDQTEFNQFLHLDPRTCRLTR